MQVGLSGALRLMRPLRCTPPAATPSHRPEMQPTRPVSERVRASCSCRAHVLSLARAPAEAPAHPDDALVWGKSRVLGGFHARYRCPSGRDGRRVHGAGLTRPCNGSLSPLGPESHGAAAMRGRLTFLARAGAEPRTLFLPLCPLPRHGPPSALVRTSGRMSGGHGQPLTDICHEGTWPRGLTGPGQGRVAVPRRLPASSRSLEPGRRAEPDPGGGRPVRLRRPAAGFAVAPAAKERGRRCRSREAFVACAGSRRPRTWFLDKERWQAQGRIRKGDLACRFRDHIPGPRGRFQRRERPRGALSQDRNGEAAPSPLRDGPRATTVVADAAGSYGS